MRNHIMSILRGVDAMERQDLLRLAVDTLPRVPVCKADVDYELAKMVEDGTVEAHDYDYEYGCDRFYILRHCGHDEPMECNAMGCQIKNPGND